jgi:hypothetical protein
MERIGASREGLAPILVGLCSYGGYYDGGASRRILVRNEANPHQPRSPSLPGTEPIR